MLFSLGASTGLYVGERSGAEECDRYYGLQISKSVLNQGAQKTDKSTEAYKLGTL
jgi:hypothetical protein